MITWLKFIEAILSLLRYVADYLDRLRTRKEVEQEQKDTQDAIIEDGKKLQDSLDNMSPDERERLRDDLDLYRSEADTNNGNKDVLQPIPTSKTVEK